MKTDDIEREYLKDQMYIIESQMQMEADYWQWEEDQQRKEAKIMVIRKSKKLEK